MPFTLVGWHESQNTGGVLTLHQAIPDPHIRVVGDDVIVPDLNFLSGYYAVGEYLTQAQLSSPSLRRLTLLDIEAFDRSREPSSRPPLHDLFGSPIELVKSEALNALMAEDFGGYGLAFWNTMFVWLSDGPVTPVTGKFFTVRATSSVTLTRYEWTNGSLTFSQTLPAGRYQIVGARARSAGLLAFRFVVPGYSWRPGAIGFDSGSDIGPERFRYGKAGVWCEFDHDAPPTVDFFSDSADTSQVLHIDLLKI